MVKGPELDNRGVNIRGQAEAETAIRRMGNKPEPVAAEATPNLEAEQELAKLKARIVQARELHPPHQGVADGRSWGMGRDDALAFLEAPG